MDLDIPFVSLTITPVLSPADLACLRNSAIPFLYDSPASSISCLMLAVLSWLALAILIYAAAVLALDSSKFLLSSLYPALYSAEFAP